MLRVRDIYTYIIKKFYVSKILILFTFFFFHAGPDQQPDNNMIVLHAAFAALLLVHSSVADAGVEEQVPVQSDEGVLVLTKDNFDNIVATSEYLLVKFCEYLGPRREDIFFFFVFFFFKG